MNSILQTVGLQHILTICNNPFKYDSIRRFLDPTENLAKKSHIIHLKPLACVSTETGNSRLWAEEILDSQIPF